MLLDSIATEPDINEVVRYLGYPSGATPQGSILDRVNTAVEAVRGKLRPRGIYALYKVAECNARSLTLCGGVTFTGPIGEYLSHADRAAVFLATAGPEIVALAEEMLAGRDTLGGLIYNSIGSALAEAAVEHIVGRLRGELGPGEDLTLRYSPGYCGISLAQQKTVFSLIDAASIGVELLPTYIMKPVKSVSGLIGIGPENGVHAFATPCERCPLADCKMRR